VNRSGRTSAVTLIKKGSYLPAFSSSSVGMRIDLKNVAIGQSWYQENSKIIDDVALVTRTCTALSKYCKMKHRSLFINFNLKHCGASITLRRKRTLVNDLLLVTTSSCMSTFRASSKTTYFLLQILQLLHAYQPVTLKNDIRSGMDVFR
jgi:hypothetical protein